MSVQTAAHDAERAPTAFGRRAPAADDRVRAAGAVLAGQPVDEVAGRHGVDREQVLLWSRALAAGGAAAVAGSDPHQVRSGPYAAGLAAQDYVQLLARELGEPLTQTRAALQTLADAPDATRADDLSLRTACEQVAQASHLADQLVDVLSVTTGDVDLHPRGVDLAGLVQAVAHRLGVPCDLDPGHQVHRVEADPGRLRQAVEALLEGALQHCAAADLSVDVVGLRGAALLTVRLGGVAPSGSAQEHDRLALYVARALTQAIGGQIGVTGHGTPEEADRATVLWVRLPLAARPALSIPA
jgi:signal transduction histidine kinase